MLKKKRVLLFVMLALLLIIACAATPLQESASEKLEMGKSEVFTFLGIIGENAQYGVYRMKDPELGTTCYIVVDEYVAPNADTNSAATIHCP